ncbi:MAG: hypothetical protein LBD08_08365 [Treponema sp.]|jgi:hypothetical protein|nr:hypothetical protein [Treponema sp.]
MKLVFFFLFIVIFSAVAETSRTTPVDMYLIIDGSASLKPGRDGAVQWLCDYAVDGILQDGDRLSVWLAAGTSQLLFSGTLGKQHSRESIKTLLRSIAVESAAADYAGAVREASKLISQRGKRLSYTLLVSGSGGNAAAMAERGEMAELLRYSRVREFAGWMAIIAAPGIGPRVRSAASAYMN